MPLVDLLQSIPTDAPGRNWWSLAHDEQHNDLIQTIKKQKNIDLIRYVLDPINLEDIEGWLLRHSQAHDDINTVLDLAGVDLSAGDFETENGRLEWAALHFREHQNWNDELEI